MIDTTKTDELIDTLSRDRFGKTWLNSTLIVMVAALLAIVIALVLSIVWLKPRLDLAPALIAENYVFGLKLVFAMCVVITALPIVRDLSVPGRRVGLGLILATIPFLVMIVLALRELGARPFGEWSRDVGHAAWLECLWQIPALAIPAFVILAIAVRHLAPTDLTRTGAYIGLLAGGIGAIAYALHCHEDSIAFVAIAYSLAIAEMTLVGALIGPRMLRWQ